MLFPKFRFTLRPSGSSKGRPLCDAGPHSPTRFFAQATFVVLVVIAASMADPKGSDAAFSGLSGKIAFSRSYFDPTIYTANADGTELQMIAEGAQPAWSPDGAQLAFVRGSSLYVANADGSNASIVTTDAWSPAWSPDGKRLAYCSSAGDTPQIFVTDLSGVNPQQITTGPGLLNCAGDSISWSPDGETIAYVSTFSLFPEVRLIGVDGSNDRKIADGSQPSWSPDGWRLLFVADSFLGDDEASIFSLDMQLQAATPTRLTNGVQPTWSPEGDQIVFVRALPPEGFMFPHQIWVMQADGSNEHKLLPSDQSGLDGWDFSPDWQPIVAAVDAQIQTTSCGSGCTGVSFSMTHYGGPDVDQIQLILTTENSVGASAMNPPPGWQTVAGPKGGDAPCGVLHAQTFGAVSSADSLSLGESLQFPMFQLAFQQFCSSEQRATIEWHASSSTVEVASGEVQVEFPGPTENLTRGIIFIQGITSQSRTSGDCSTSQQGFVQRPDDNHGNPWNRVEWIVDDIVNAGVGLGLDKDVNFFYFSYSGAYCDQQGIGPPGYRLPKYSPEATCGYAAPGEREGIRGYADELQAMITNLSQRYPDATFDIIAHSMGGMVASYWLFDNPGMRNKVHSVVTFDSPLRGVGYVPGDVLSAALDSTFWDVCPGNSPSFADLECDDFDNTTFECPIPQSMGFVGGENTAFYTLDAARGDLGWFEFVADDRTTLLNSNSKIHCQVDDSHSPIWDNLQTEGDRTVNCWSNFRWSDNRGDPFRASDSDEVKGEFVACAIRGDSGSDCMGKLGQESTPSADFNSAANSGDTEIQVADTGSLAVGDSIILNPGMPNEEANVVAGFGSIILEYPLRFPHEAGEPIFAAPAGSTVVQGDVDCDSDVDAVDALQVLREVAGLSTQANCVRLAGDPGCNGNIDAVDALAILRFVANLPAGQVGVCSPVGQLVLV